MTFTVSFVAVLLAACACKLVVAETCPDAGPVVKTGKYDYTNTAWETVSDDFATCGTGKEQSPINVESCGAMSNEEKPVFKMNEAKMNHSASTANFAMNCLNDASTPCSRFVFQNVTYSMLQFHAHTPSENTLNGQSYPLEIHFVHASEDMKLAVLGVFFKVGKHNEGIQRMLDAAEGRTHTFIKISDWYEPAGMLCKFPGSLTTPPCSEGVSWFVSWAVNEMSQEQVDKYIELIGGTGFNNRPLQPLNGRMPKCLH